MNIPPTIILGLIVVLISVLLFLLATPEQKEHLKHADEIQNPWYINMLLFPTFAVAIAIGLTHLGLLPPITELFPVRTGIVQSVAYESDAEDGDHYAMTYLYRVDGVDYSGRSSSFDLEEPPYVGLHVTIYYLPLWPSFSFTNSMGLYKWMFFITVFAGVLLAMAWSGVTGQPLRPYDG